MGRSFFITAAKYLAPTGKIHTAVDFMAKILYPMDKSEQQGGITMSDLMLLMLALLACFVLPIALVIREVRHRRVQMEQLEEEEHPIRQAQATVLDKKIQRIDTGSYKTPSHHLGYLVLFQLADGGQMQFSLPAEQYDVISVMEQGLLVFQGETLLDFHDHFGVEQEDAGE